MMQKEVNLLLMSMSLIMLWGCFSSSYDDWREKGREKTRVLLEELKHIRTKDQLLQREAELKRAFDEIHHLLLQVKAYQEQHSHLEPPPLNLSG